jgi:tol-pal system protein YbgF
MAGLALAIVFSASASAQDADPSMMANMVMQVQELQDEVRTLRGMLEEQTRELENLKRRQRDQYLDLDQRISDVRNAQPVGPGPVVSTQSATNPPTVSPSAGRDEPEVRGPMETESQVTGIGEPMVQSQVVQASPESEKAAYDQAFQALKELRYADAAQDFQSFLDQYPGSEYADNAQYWLAESYYVTGNYRIALESFQTLIARFPGSSKAQDATLKLAFTHYELKQWDEAERTLNQVLQQFPNTTVARLAENRLRTMRIEGHIR